MSNSISIRRPVKTISLTVLKGLEKGNMGGFSEPSKMPWLSWSISAELCQIGSKLREVEGSVCEDCYACKGRYVMPNVKDAMERRYNTMGDLDTWKVSMAHHIGERALRYEPTESEPLPSFRWHDSGDLQSAAHLEAIVWIAENTQNITLADGTIGDVEYWLPTRQYDHVQTFLREGGVIPRNLCVRLSAHKKDGPTPDGFGLPVSSVHVKPLDEVYPDAHGCPAYTQGGKCLDCRACWDKTVPHVSYPHH